MGGVKLFQKCPYCGFKFEVAKSRLSGGGIRFYEVEKRIQKCPKCGRFVEIKF